MDVIDDQGTGQAGSETVEFVDNPAIDQGTPAADDQSSQATGTGTPESGDQGVLDLDQMRSDLDQLRSQHEETQRDYAAMRTEFQRRNQQGGWGQPYQQGPQQPGQPFAQPGQGQQQPAIQPWAGMTQEDTQALGVLNNMIAQSATQIAQQQIQQYIGPLQQQQQDMGLDMRFNQMAIKYPGYDRKAVLDLLTDTEKVPDEELAWWALKGKEMATQAAQDTKKNMLRKQAANTASGKGQAPGQRRIRRYDPKLDAGKSASDIVADLREEGI